MKNSGFLLEKCGEEISWGILASELKSIGSPQVREKPPKCEFFWENELVLGGLSAGVSAELFGKQRLQEVRIYTYDEGLDSSTEAHYNRIKSHMEKMYGPASSTVKVDWASLPTSNWHTKYFSFSLWVMDRFGEYCITDISRPKKA